MTKGENKGMKGGRMSGIAENEEEKIWNLPFFPHEAWEMTKGRH